MIPQYLDFRRLKQIVSIERVLSHKGLMGRFKRQADRLIGPCPIHNGDNPHAFVVTPSKNIWHCFTRCNTGGDIVDLVRFMDHISHRQTAEYLSKIANIPQTPVTPIPHVSITSTNKTFRPFTMRLNLNPYTSYLEKKGIEPITAMRFDSGIYHGKGFLENCIGVRLHDLNGHPLGYVGRRLVQDDEKKYGKWKFPYQFPKNDILYNFHRSKPHLDRGVVITECPWSVMRLAQLNIPAIALLGLHLSTSLHYIFRKIPRVVLMLDGDQAGQLATDNLYHLLKSFTYVDFVHLPPNLDPDDLRDDALIDILKNFF